jgi:hypothetical protein
MYLKWLKLLQMEINYCVSTEEMSSWKLPFK